MNERSIRRWFTLSKVVVVVVVVGNQVGGVGLMRMIIGVYVYLSPDGILHGSIGCHGGETSACCPGRGEPISA